MEIRQPKEIGEVLKLKISRDAQKEGSKLGRQLPALAAELRASLLGIGIDVEANEGRISMKELEATGLALRKFGGTYVFVRPKANSGFPVDAYHGKKHSGPNYVMSDGSPRVIELNGSRIRIEVHEDELVMQEESG